MQPIENQHNITTLSGAPLVPLWCLSGTGRPITLTIQAAIELNFLNYETYRTLNPSINVMSTDYAQIIDGCRHRNARAQRALYDEVAPMAMGICMRYTRGRDDAQDMLQEGMVKVFERIGRLNDPARLKSWVARIMVRTCIDHLKQRRWMTLPDGDIPEEPSFTIDPFEAETVVAALQTLPPQQRAVFNMCEVDGYQQSEVAEQLGCSQNNVRVLLCRAKDSLRKQLSNQQQYR